MTQIAVSKDEDLIAFGTQKGIVCILQRNENGVGAKLINKSTEHLGHEITTMKWTSKNQIYFGDCNGKVTSIYVSLFVVSINSYRIFSYLYLYGLMQSNNSK